MSSKLDPGRAELVRTVQAAARGLHTAVDTLNQTVADQLGVNRTDLRCIQLLGLAGPMTAGQLAEASWLTTGAVTTVIDRIEKAGFARRVRDVVDRRRIYVELTPSAGQRMFAIYRDLVTSSAASVECYTDAELLLIREFLQRGREVTLAHVERVKTMPNEPAHTARPAEPARPD